MVNIVKLFIFSILLSPSFVKANKYTDDYSDSFYEEYIPKDSSGIFFYLGIGLLFLYCFWGFRTPFKKPYSKIALVFGVVSSLLMAWFLLYEKSPLNSLPNGGLVGVIFLTLPLIISIASDYFKDKSRPPKKEIKVLVGWQFRVGIRSGYENTLDTLIHNYAHNYKLSKKVNDRVFCFELSENVTFKVDADYNIERLVHGWIYQRKMEAMDDFNNKAGFITDSDKVNFIQVS